MGVGGLRCGYEDIWNVSVPYKVKMFVWLAIMDRLNTISQLNKKGIQVDRMCVLCEKESEDCVHMFLK